MINIGVRYEADAMASSVQLEDYLEGLAAQGMDQMEMEAHMQEMFESGRGPLADFKAGIVSTNDALVSRVVAIDHARELSGGDTTMIGTWVSTGGRNVCPGCAERNGTRMTEAEFEELHGTHECGARCYCFWMPGEITVQEAGIRMEKLYEENPGWFNLSYPLEITQFRT